VRPHGPLAAEHLLLRMRPVNRVLRAAVERQAAEAALLDRPDLTPYCIPDEQVRRLLDRVPVGRLAGFPIHLSPSWLLLAAVAWDAPTGEAAWDCFETAAGRPYPRWTITGTPRCSAAHAASRSPPTAEPPMPAITTSVGRARRTGGSGTSASASRHWVEKAARTSRTRCGSRSSYSRGSSSVIWVPP